MIKHASARSADQMVLICFSHLRWDFVFQRPQHLMIRFARTMRVIYLEEPVTGGEAPELVLREVDGGVTVAVPHLPGSLDRQAQVVALRELLDGMLAEHRGPLLRWYYTPMMLTFSGHLQAACTVYDCMDELASFRFAPPELVPLEGRLLELADLVFTGGYSLYEAKRDLHPAVHPFKRQRGAFLRRAHDASRARGSGGPGPPQVWLLRRDRRANGPRPHRRPSRR